jgi:DNA-binding MarR family transcriptional regulator
VDPTLRPAKTDPRRRTAPPAGKIRQKNRELGLLSEIERDPDATQAGLAVKLGVAVGTVNWHLKRLIAKGYIKVKRAERRKLRYIITPSGIGLRARLTVAYIETSMALYRQVRKQARQALSQVRQKGYQQVRIEGDGDLADVCRLTCLEMGVRVESTVGDGSAAVLQIDGRKVRFIDLGHGRADDVDS